MTRRSRRYGAFAPARTAAARLARLRSEIAAILKSPEMFLQLGDGCGLVSHIATYWRYQFPRGRPLAANVLQLMDTLQDFEASLGADDAMHPNAA